MLSVSAKPQISYSWMFPSVLCFISLVSRRCSSSLVRLASGKHHVWLKWLLRMENLELLWKVDAFVVGKPAGKSLQETFRGFSGLTRAPHVLLAVINPPLMMKQAPIEHLRQDACTKMESKQKNMEERRQFSNYCCSWDETLKVCTTYELNLYVFITFTTDVTCICMCILYFFGQNSDFYTTVMTRLVSLPHESLPLHRRHVTPGGDPEWNLNERRHTHFNLTAGGCVCVCVWWISPPVKDRMCSGLGGRQEGDEKVSQSFYVVAGRNVRCLALLSVD